MASKPTKSPIFQFKQFAVRHDLAALRITTDATVLGAWVQPQNARNVLDLGTGCGVIGLMLAQRSDANFTLLDIEPAAIIQTEENISQSPWHRQMQAVCADVRRWQGGPFDLIVSNPPYYTGQLATENAARNRALHDASLTLPELALALDRLLTADGTCWLCLPPAEMQQLTALLRLHGLFPLRSLHLADREGLPVIRVFRGFGRSESPAHDTQHLLIRQANGQYQPEYAALLQPYLTIF